MRANLVQLGLVGLVVALFTGLMTLPIAADKLDDSRGIGGVSTNH